MSALSLVEQTVRIAIPYLFAASGGVLAERAGVVSLGLEGYMLTGAFSAITGAHATGSAWVGLLTGMAGALILGALHAVASIRFKADQIVSGIALNLLGIGATRLFLKLVFKSSSNSARVEGFKSAYANPLLWVGLATIPVLSLVLARTRYGLRVRAVGEHPGAAESVGISVAGVRAVAVLASAGLAGLGGAYLAFEQHQFTAEMTAGRGFIALAAVIVGGWRPLYAGLACVLFAAAETLQIQLQALQIIPSQVLSMVPYVLTIAVLLMRFAPAGARGASRTKRGGPPAALGKP